MSDAPELTWRNRPPGEKPGQSRAEGRSAPIALISERSDRRWTWIVPSCPTRTNRSASTAWAKNRGSGSSPDQVRSGWMSSRASAAITSSRSAARSSGGAPTSRAIPTALIRDSSARIRRPTRPGLRASSARALLHERRPSSAAGSAAVPPAA